MTQRIHGLTPVQARFVAALATSRTVAEAAHRAGIRKETASRWLRNPAVLREYGRIVDEALGRAVASLGTATDDAVAVLRDLLREHYPPPVRLAAAKAILDSALRLGIVGGQYRHVDELRAVAGKLIDAVTLHVDDETRERIARDFARIVGLALDSDRCLPAETGNGAAAGP